MGGGGGDSRCTPVDRRASQRRPEGSCGCVFGSRQPFRAWKSLVYRCLPTFSNELLPRGTPLIFWCHHNPDQQGLVEIDCEVAQSLSATVFVSDYQKERARRFVQLSLGAASGSMGNVVG